MNTILKSCISSTADVCRPRFLTYWYICTTIVTDIGTDVPGCFVHLDGLDSDVGSAAKGHLAGVPNRRERRA
jgi:hypothetical protein